MTRGDIGNYLGLTVETISRLLGRFQKSGLISVKGKTYHWTTLPWASWPEPLVLPAVNLVYSLFAGSDLP